MSIEGGDCADRAENGEEEEECVEIEPWPLPPLPSRSCSAASFSLASATASARSHASAYPSSMAMQPPWPRLGCMAWAESPRRATRPEALE